MVFFFLGLVFVCPRTRVQQKVGQASRRPPRASRPRSQRGRDVCLTCANGVRGKVSISVISKLFRHKSGNGIPVEQGSAKPRSPERHHAPQRGIGERESPARRREVAEIGRASCRERV